MGIPKYDGPGVRPINVQRAFKNAAALWKAVAKARNDITARRSPCNYCGRDMAPILMERLIVELGITREVWDEMRDDDTLSTEFGEICQRVEREALADIVEWMCCNPKNGRPAELMLASLDDRYNRAFNASMTAKGRSQKNRTVKVQRVKTENEQNQKEDKK